MSAKIPSWLKFPAGIIAGGLVSIVASFPCFEIIKYCRVSQINNKTSASITQKDQEIADYNSRILQATAKNKDIKKIVEELSSPNAGQLVPKFEKEKNLLEAESKSYREMHQTEITQAEFDALRADHEELAQLSKKHAAITVSIQNFQKTIKEYKLLHPEELTEQKYKELEEKILQQMGQAKALLEVYMQTHPENVTKQKYSALENKLAETNRKISEIEQASIEYKKTHPEAVTKAAYEILEKRNNATKEEYKKVLSSVCDSAKNNAVNAWIEYRRMGNEPGPGGERMEEYLSRYRRAGNEPNLGGERMEEYLSKQSEFKGTIHFLEACAKVWNNTYPEDKCDISKLELRVMEEGNKKIN